MATVTEIDPKSLCPRCVYAYVANAPTRFRDPLGLYMSWAHRDLTVEEAEKCGFTRRDAKRLGRANERVDTRHPESWLSNKSP